MKDNMNKAGAVVLVIALILLIGLVLSIPMALLWNYSLVPAIPALQEVGILQMYGIYLLCVGLFKSYK